MRENEEDFFDFGQRKSLEHRDWFDNNPVSESLQKQFIETAQESLVRQKQIEQGDNLSFDEFLQQYFSNWTDRTRNETSCCEQSTECQKRQ